jgi:CMP-N-acetylneuraminic acid synthetase
MTILGLVTARGGSKRLPGKNLATIGRESLVKRAWWTMNELRKRVPLTLRLSTDSQAIADEWPSADRPLKMRPAWLATDTAKSVDVCKYEVWQLRNRGVDVQDMSAPKDPEVDVVVLLQPTSPLVWWQDLASVLEAVHERGCAVGVNGQGKPFGVWAVTPKYMRMHEAVCVEGECTRVEIPNERCVDIDTRADLDAARVEWERQAMMAHNTGTTDCL